MRITEAIMMGLVIIVCVLSFCLHASYRRHGDRSCFSIGNLRMKAYHWSTGEMREFCVNRVEDLPPGWSPSVANLMSQIRSDLIAWSSITVAAVGILVSK